MQRIAIYVVAIFSFAAGCAPVIDYPPQGAAASLPVQERVTLQTENEYRLDRLDGVTLQGKGKAVSKINTANTPNDRVTFAPGRHQVTVAYLDTFVIRHASIEHDFVAGHSYFIGPKNAFDAKNVKLSDATSKQAWIVATGENVQKTSDANRVK